MPRGHVLPDRDTIATLRGEAGLTQQGLADQTGYGVRTISKIESGQATSASTLAAIAIVLAESLGRPIHLVDLICQANGSGRGWQAAGGTAIVAEQIRLLDWSRRSGRFNRRAGRCRAGGRDHRHLSPSLCAGRVGSNQFSLSLDSRSDQRPFVVPSR